MWDWLTGLSGSPKLRPKHLDGLLEQLQETPPGTGDEAFSLHEKELKRLCSAAK